MSLTLSYANKQYCLRKNISKDSREYIFMMKAIMHQQQ